MQCTSPRLGRQSFGVVWTQHGYIFLCSFSATHGDHPPQGFAIDCLTLPSEPLQCQADAPAAIAMMCRVKRVLPTKEAVCKVWMASSAIRSALGPRQLFCKATLRVRAAASPRRLALEPAERSKNAQGLKSRLQRKNSWARLLRSIAIVRDRARYMVATPCRLVSLRPANRTR